jgi:hypothetical protein
MVGLVTISTCALKFCSFRLFLSLHHRVRVSWRSYVRYTYASCFHFRVKKCSVAGFFIMSRKRLRGSC